MLEKVQISTCHISLILVLRCQNACEMGLHRCRIDILDARDLAAGSFNQATMPPAPCTHQKRIFERTLEAAYLTPCDMILWLVFISRCSNKRHSFTRDKPKTRHRKLISTCQVFCLTATAKSNLWLQHLI